MFVLGDFNAHHSSWHCSRCNVEGEKLVKAFENSNMIVMNDDCSTFMTTSGSGTNVIDLSVASRDLALLCECFAGSDSWGSDHYPVYTRIEGMLHRAEIHL